MDPQQPGRRFWNRRVILVALGAATLGFLAAAVLYGKPWRLPPDWGDIPTWIAATAAIYGGWLALTQLREQQDTIKGEIERTKNRDRLLDAQLREMQDRESFRLREQAEAVELQVIPRRLDSGPYNIIVVNESRRPIRKLQAWTAVGADGRKYGTLQDTSQETVPILRARQRVTFSLPGSDRSFSHPHGSEGVLFTDDAGHRWDLGSDLHLIRRIDPVTGMVPPVPGWPS